MRSGANLSFKMQLQRNIFNMRDEKVLFLIVNQLTKKKDIKKQIISPLRESVYCIMNLNVCNANLSMSIHILFEV